MIEVRILDCGNDTMKNLPVRIISKDRIKKIKKSQRSHKTNKKIKILNMHQ